MQDKGYRLRVEDVTNPSPIKLQYGVPATLQSCHTAIVDGYVIEGHVPVEEIERLLTERPPVTGLAVPGMPVGSPGMEIAGAPAEPYEVLAFYPDGRIEVYARYGQ